MASVQENGVFAWFDFSNSPSRRNSVSADIGHERKRKEEKVDIIDLEEDDDHSTSFFVSVDLILCLRLFHMLLIFVTVRSESVEQSFTSGGWRGKIPGRQQGQGIATDDERHFGVFACVRREHGAAAGPGN